MEPSDGAGDAELVERVRAGDEGAWEVLYLRHLVPLSRRCLSQGLATNKEDARDIACDALSLAWQHVAGFRGHASFSTWLYAIAKNVRQVGPECLSLDAAWDKPEDKSDMSDQDQQELGYQVGCTIAELPEPLDEVGMCLLHGGTIRDISARLGVSFSKAKYLRQKCLATLRRDLGPTYNTFFYD